MLLCHHAVTGSCTCMQKEQMWPPCSQSPWGRLQIHAVQNPRSTRAKTRKLTVILIFCYFCTPLFFDRGEHCGGCRRSNNTERPHAFQVILTERPPLVLSANNEQDMADWMQILCQSVSKGVRRDGAVHAYHAFDISDIACISADSLITGAQWYISQYIQ